MKKVYLKGDGSKERGKKIIKYLESLGGKNRDEWEGNNTISCYYYIGCDNNITFNSVIPEGYMLIDLPEEKTFPREMLVWDIEDTKKIKAKVLAYIPGYETPWIAESTLLSRRIVTWEFAEEIPENLKWSK